jgi:hypothetical protein
LPDGAIVVGNIRVAGYQNVKHRRPPDRSSLRTMSST